MATIEKSTIIAAPAEQIFAVISEPTNLPEIWPSLVGVHDITPAANGGSDFKWTYKMVGIRLEGASTCVEFTAPRRLSVETKGGISSITTWSVEPDGESTRVTLRSDLTVPGKLLGKLAEPLVMRENSREAETILANLKKRLEQAG
jgi:carbon monoxide dehydrogenase subunit G